MKPLPLAGWILFIWAPLLLAACSGGDGQGTTKGKRKWIIGFSQCNNAEPWRAA